MSRESAAQWVIQQELQDHLQNTERCDKEGIAGKGGGWAEMEWGRGSWGGERWWSWWAEMERGGEVELVGGDGVGAGRGGGAGERRWSEGRERRWSWWT